MILDPKKIIYILILFYGFYFFYSEFNKLNNYGYKFNKNNISNIKIENDQENLEIKKIEKNSVIKKKITESKLDKTIIIVSKGDTFSSILNKFSLSDAKIFEIINKIEKFYKLNKLKVNDKINQHILVY